MADRQAAEKTAPVSLPEWMSEKRVLIAWIVSFGILILLSFFVFVPVAITMDDTDGNCFLYASHYGFGETSVCSYCIAIAVIFLCICIPRLLLLIMKITTFSTKTTDVVSSWFSIWGVHFVIFFLDVFLLLLLLVTACLLSAGLSDMCGELFGGRDLCSSDYGVALPSGEVNTSFYTNLSFAEGSAWVTFCYWSIIVILETFMLWKNGTVSKVVSVVRKGTPSSGASSATSAKESRTSFA